MPFSFSIIYLSQNDEKYPTNCQKEMKYDIFRIKKSLLGFSLFLFLDHHYYYSYYWYYLFAPFCCTYGDIIIDSCNIFSIYEGIRKRIFTFPLRRLPSIARHYKVAHYYPEISLKALCGIVFFHFYSHFIIIITKACESFPNPSFFIYLFCHFPPLLSENSQKVDKVCVP